METQKNPAPPEILAERDRLIVRFGDFELVTTKDGITIQPRSRNRSDPLSIGG